MMHDESSLSFRKTVSPIMNRLDEGATTPTTEPAAKSRLAPARSARNNTKKTAGVRKRNVARTRAPATPFPSLHAHRALVATNRSINKNTPVMPNLKTCHPVATNTESGEKVNRNPDNAMTATPRAATPIRMTHILTCCSDIDIGLPTESGTLGLCVNRSALSPARRPPLVSWCRPASSPELLEEEFEEFPPARRHVAEPKPSLRPVVQLQKDAGIPVLVGDPCSLDHVG